MPTFEVSGPDGKTYRVNAPAGATQADAIAYVADTYYPGGYTPPIKSEPLAYMEGDRRARPITDRAIAAASPLAATARPTATAPAPWEYITNRDQAIQRAREARRQTEEWMQSGMAADVQTQTGFLDRVGDLFTKGILNVRSGVKDVEAAIEKDPELKQEFQKQARQYAADTGIKITGAKTEEDVKRDFIRNVVPYVAEKAVESLPQMAAAAATPIGAVISALATTGSVGRERAESSGRQDVSGVDVAIASPFAIASSALDMLGLSGIAGAPAKAAALRVLQSGAIEGTTEGVQELIEYIGGRLGTEKGMDAKEAFERAMFGALAGAGIGGALRTTAEVAKAPFKAPATEVPPTAPPPGAPPATAPALRTVTIEAAPDPEVDPEGAPRPTPIDILSEPDGDGNVFVRFPDGKIVQSGIEDIEALAIPEPTPAAPEAATAAPEPAVAPEPTPAPAAAAAPEPAVMPEPTVAPEPAMAPEPTVATSPEPIDVTGPAVTAAPEPVVAPEPGPTTPRPAPTASLPVELSRAKPTYGFGPKQFGLTFDNDIDKAVYIATSGKPSKRRDLYSGWLTSQGLTEPEIADIGKRIRDGLKATARSTESGQPISVPPYYTPAPETEVGVVPPSSPAPTLETPAAAPEPTPEPVAAGVKPPPEIAPFTAEAGERVGATDLDLIKKLKGKTVSGVAQYLEQNASAPVYRRIAALTRGMIDALEGRGLRYNFGIAGRGGEMPIEATAAKRGLTSPGASGLNIIWGPRGKGTVARIDVAVRGRPLPSGGEGINEETVLHELLHAASAGTVRASDRLPKDSRAAKAVADLKRLHTKVLAGIPSLKGDALAAYERLHRTNAFRNADELLAWGLTNYDMQQVLKAIPVEKANAFTKFVEVVGDMLGIGPNDRNALRSLIEITEDILPTEAAAQREIAEAVVEPGVRLSGTGASVVPQEMVEPEVSEPTIEATVLEARQPTQPPQRPTPVTNPATKRAALNFTLQDENLVQRLGRQWVDKLNRLRYAEKAIGEAAGAPIPRAVRPSELADLLDARAQTRLDDLERDHIKKIIDLMKSKGISPAQADYFLLARTAPYRNAKIATINPNMPDGGSGITTANARAAMAQFIASGDMPKLRRLGRLVDDLAQFQRDTMVQYGLISQARADALKQEEPYYVPLKGLATSGDMSFDGSPETDVGTGSRGFSISPKEYRMAKGRGDSKLPNSPLATLMADTQRTILRGERNRVGQSFLNDIALKYPSKYWRVYTDANPDTYQRLNPNTGLLETVPKQMDAREYFVVKTNGVPSYIKFNDPVLERAMLNLSAQELGPVTRAITSTIGAATRVMSRLHTTYNPEFVITNALRDVQAAIFSILAEQGRADGRLVGKKILSDVMKDVGDWRTFRSLMKATFNHTATTAQQAATNALFQQAKEDGAFTGWVMRETPEEQYKKIQRALGKATATGKEKVWYSTLDGAKRVVSAIEDFNSVFENNIRFAVYKNALSAGLSRDEAANMARKVTVDFGRKGEFGPIANSLYAFFNATIQGNVALLRALTNVNFKQNGVTLPQKIALGSIVLGASLALLGAATSDEDDDGELFYDKIPDYEKERNLIIMNPVDGRTYLKIPMAYGYSMFPALGANIADAMRGEKTAGDLGMSIVSGLMNNFSPIQRSGETLKGLATSAFPTLMKPFADLAVNENFFGGEIYNEPFDNAQAQSSVSRYSTPEAYKGVVRFLNEATGGHGKIKGAVDLPAEGIEYLLTQYIGGVGNLMLKTVDLGGRAATGREVGVKDIPMVRRLIGEPSNGVDIGNYYDRTDKVAVAQRELKDADSSEARRFLKEKYPVDLSPRVIAARKSAESKLKKINEKKRALSDSSLGMVDRMKRMDELNEQQRGIYLQFNRVYNEVKRGQ